ncbi:MAG: redoxin domain-containing protein [Bacteroidales bacterium]|nr:redoxin domain-containing protein [Bacteroidales bacterium]
MNKIIFILLFLCVSISLHAQKVYEHQFLVKVGDQVPDFTVLLNNGSTFTLSEQKGKVVMLQFTASWCSVCRDEMPYIEKDIWRPLRDKDFVLVGMDYKESPDKVDEFAKQMQVSYPLGLDTTGAAYHLFSQKGSGVTRNVIIDKNGKIIYLSRLFNLKEFEEMKKVIFKEFE